MGTDGIKKGTLLMRMSGYLLAVTLVFFLISALCAVNTVNIPASADGIIDLTGVDFDTDTVSVSPGAAFVYAGAFYTPEDFTSGKVSQEAERIVKSNLLPGDFGTARYLLTLPAGQIYTLTSKSAAYAQRLFINGEEYNSIGVTGSDADSVTPKIARYTETFLPQNDTTEIIIHYSNFVHTYAGNLFDLKLGLVDNISRIGQLRVLQVVVITGALLTAMLFFFGLFLFFPASRYLLWFSLTCGCIALRGLITGDRILMLLLPGLDWYTVIRLEYLSVCGMVVFSALYLNGLFPGAVNKTAVRGFSVYISAVAVFFILAPTIIFTRFVWPILAVVVVFLFYAMIVILAAVIRRKVNLLLSVAEQILLLSGLSIYMLLSAFEIYAHETANYLLGIDYAQAGMTVCLFVSILALALGFARTERTLDETLKSEHEMDETNQMLERLDKLRTDFLANISHEIKTPLTVADGFAQYTLAQINEGTVGEDTKENLRIISSEANRLSELADVLLRVSADMVWERKTASVAAVIERAAATCRPVLAKNNNRLETHIEDNLPPVRVNGDMIHQVLLNLVVNANKHTRGGVVVISGALKDGMTAITVSDNGAGIAPELLPDIFNRRVSGGGGAGLGLAICKEIINIHNGKIEAGSEPGAGTRVTFTLPGEGESADEPNNPDD